MAETQDPIITDKADAFRAIDEDLSGSVLDRLSDELKADKEVIMAAVKRNGFALEYASDELKADKEVVLAAAKSDDPLGYGYMILKYASDELKADKDVVMALMENKDFQFKKNLAAAIGMSVKELKERFSC